MSVGSLSPSDAAFPKPSSLRATCAGGYVEAVWGSFRRQGANPGSVVHPGVG